MAQTETQSIKIRSPAQSHFINQELKYDLVYQLPDDAFRIETYDSGRAHHEFQNYYYYSGQTDKFYSRHYLILPTSVQKKTGTQIVYLTDSNDRRVAETVNFVDQSLSQWYDQYILQYSEKYPQKIYTQHKPKKSKKVKDDLFQVIPLKQFPFKSKYEVIRKANYYDIPTHQTKNQFDIYPQTNTLEPHDYQLKPLAKFERPYFSPNYNSWEIDQVFIMKKSVEIKQYLFAINTTIEINNENESEQVEQQIEKRSVGRPKKYFNDEDRKEAIRKQQLATKRRYAQKKAQIYSRNNTVQKQLMKLLSDHNFKEDDMGFLLEYLETDMEQKIIPNN
ncbi:MAG: hypothetical protein EZS28_028457 [Streblomastix strix]|uniref:Uncharacterized protein n=1 Tax=Streblomastix strix TaxID=222440 RepID=A0A5J4UZ69_9EUKA|nr:MAG: hypothetical protein EZS28_028457 [Streblomastix strix]